MLNVLSNLSMEFKISEMDVAIWERICWYNIQYVLSLPYVKCVFIFRKRHYSIKVLWHLGCNFIVNYYQIKASTFMYGTDIIAVLENISGAQIKMLNSGTSCE